jgi:hypothetical protein
MSEQKIPDHAHLHLILDLAIDTKSEDQDAADDTPDPAPGQ